MKRFETVVIERRGSHFQACQGEQLLLSVPQAVFEAYEPHDVFPLEWRPVRQAHPVRVFFWNPNTREFLMAGLEAHPARTAEAFGSSPYRSFLQGLWISTPPTLFLRPFWHPADPYDAFDRPARKKSFEIHQEFYDLLANLRPPARWSAVLNATDAYLDALGVSLRGSPDEPESVHEVSLTPPACLADDEVASALEVLATEHVGAAFPVLQENVLMSVQALSLPDMHGVEALLVERQIAYQRGPYRPH